MPDIRELRSSLPVFAEAVGCPLTPWQARSLALEARTTVIVAPRQTGKSRSLAVLALHRAFRSPGLRALIISAGEDAARRLLAQASAVATNSPLLRGSVVDETAGLLTLTNGSEIRSVPASERQVRGWSVDLLLVDEAAHVDDELLLGAALPTTAARPEARIVLASSPGGSEGAFYGFAQRGGSGSVHVATVSWRLTDAPWIATGVVEAAREQLPAEAFAREFLGEFANVGQDERVIPRDWIDEAQRRTLEPSGLPVYGVDVARHGGDETVAVGVRGGVVRVVWAMRGADLMQTAGRVARLAATPGARMSVDAIGLGFGVVDRLRELGVSVHPFVASVRSSSPRRFLNLRAEAWWHAREVFRRGAVDIDPTDRVLAGQLGAVTYDLSSSGAVRIGSKDQMRQSPDRADALVLALWSARAQREMAAWRARARRAPRREDATWRDVAMPLDEFRQRATERTLW